MKLSNDSFKLRSNDTGGYFARALRVIGQDLAELFPQRLEIEFCEGVFDVRISCDRKRAEQKNPAARRSGLTGIIHKLANYRLDKPPAGTDIATLERHYSSDELGRLDRAGLHRRSQAGKIPDINNLGEALRTIGRMIDAEGGELRRILTDARRVVLDYTDKKGSMQKKEMTRSELFKAQQSHYASRSGSGSVDPWKGNN